MNRRLLIVFILKAIFILILFNIFIYDTASASTCIIIKKMKFESKVPLMYKNIKRILDKYLNKCLEQDDLQEIVRKITNLYIDHGYITSRVELPEQDISENVLYISIIEGFIEDIDISDNHKLISPFLPIKKGKILSCNYRWQYNKYGSHKICC